MANTTVNIHPNVALNEQAELVEFYRNRNLILAQTLFDTQAAIAALQKQIDDAKVERQGGDQGENS